MSVVQILIVDDCLPWQRFVQNHIDATTEFKVIAVAADGPEAVQRADELHPDVILMDVCLPGMDGIEATRQIRKLSPGSKILFLSMFDDFDVLRSAFDAGGSGYICKWDAGRDLIPGIRAVLLGQRFVSNSVTGWHGSSSANV
jgi:DNA-binding NarL/FixJ family response regulator